MEREQKICEKQIQIFKFRVQASNFLHNVQTRGLSLIPLQNGAAVDNRASPLPAVT